MNKSSPENFGDQPCAEIITIDSWLQKSEKPRTADTDHHEGIARFGRELGLLVVKHDVVLKVPTQFAPVIQLFDSEDIS